MKSIHLNLTILFIVASLVQDARADFFCHILGGCSNSTITTTTTTSENNLISSGVPSATLDLPSTIQPPLFTSTTLPPQMTSSFDDPHTTTLQSSTTFDMPTSTYKKPTTSSTLPPLSSSSWLSSGLSATPTMSGSANQSPVSSSSTSAAPSQTSETQNSSSTNKNTGAIIGAVCGVAALLGAGFAYAFFSKTKRRRERQERLNSNSGDPFDSGYNNQADNYNNNGRPSPALAANNIHQNQYEMTEPYQNNNMPSPQPPIAATVMHAHHDPYYASPQMSYATNPSTNYYNQPYYDTGMGYQQHYDPYVASAPPVMPFQGNTMAYDGSNKVAMQPATNPPVYSAPHTYPENILQKPSAHD